MKRNLASALAIGATAAIALATAALSPNKAYADDITIDTAPFVSTRSRDEVRAELMSHRQAVIAGATEWALQLDTIGRPASDYTRAQATADFLASRPQVSALSGEDSGSLYLARMARRSSGGTIVAGTRVR